MTLLLLGAGGLLVLSALISAAEAAAFTPGESRLRTLREEGFQNAEALALLREDPSATLLTLGLLETLLNLAVAAISVYVGFTAGGTPGFFGALGAAVLVVLVVGEVIPRALARRHPVRFALASAPTLLAMRRVVGPLIAPLSRLEQQITQAGEPEIPRSDQERVLDEIADLGRREGVLGDEENQLVERAFRMDELTVWEVMTPRVDVYALDGSLTLDQVMEELESIPYSRVPVYEGTVDEISGILHVREAYAAWVKGDRTVPLKEIARDAIFVPSSMSLTRCLRLFQLRRVHMGIVADEYGGTDGLVTLEDVLEELVGEIEDERDLPEVSLIRIARGEAIADGSIDLREVNKTLDVELPLEEHRSLNGLILETMGRVPAPGESLLLDGLEVEVVEASETQVIRVRLRRSEPSAAPEE